MRILGGVGGKVMNGNRNPNNMSCPVAVVCKDGVSRAGVYCVASYCFDQVAVSREGGKKQADIYQAVKLVKKVRPKLITGIEEYKYCYELIQTFVEKYRMLEKTSLIDRVSIQVITFIISLIHISLNRFLNIHVACLQE